MERRATAKPYAEALANYPAHKEELDVLPKKYYAIIARYPYAKGRYPIDKEDFFGNLVLYCIEADSTVSNKDFYKRALHIVNESLREQRREAEKLYNPYRNLRLDQCYGESKSPLVDWMNFDEFL